MKKIYNLLIVLAVPAIFLVFTSQVFYPGGSPGGRTGSPGDGGATCTGCHSEFTPINQIGWITSSMMATGYTPGEVYDIIVVGIDSSADKFGFEATAEDQTGTKVGTFDPGMMGRSQLCNSNNAVTHTLLGTTPIVDTGTVWVFTWTAPMESVGDITFYAAINAADGNGGTSGDQIHLSQFTASPAVGITDNLASKTVNFYPNPATDFIYVESISKTQDNNIMEIMNLHGQTVKRAEISELKQSIDISELKAGIYFVRSGNYTERLVIR